MATFNYVVGRTSAFRSVECGIDIPSLWTATVIDGMPEGKTMNSGSAATEKEAVNFLVHKMKQAGYTGFLVRVNDVTSEQKVKPVIPTFPVKKRKAMAMQVSHPAVKVTSVKENAKKSDVASKTVTVEVFLDTDRETLKAYKIYNRAYVAKSISRFQPKGRATRANNGKEIVRVQRGMLTLPVWLYDKL